MEITTRRATLADANIISEVASKTYYDTFTGTCTENDMQQFLGIHFNLDQIQQELGNEAEMYYLAEADGQVAGYTKFMENYDDFPLMKQWKSLELKRIYVLDQFHGKGVAQVLMDLVLQYAKDNRFEAVYLGVWEHNLKAQKFYEKYGFAKSGHTHYFPIGDTPQTDYWLWKFL